GRGIGVLRRGAEATSMADGVRQILALFLALRGVSHFGKPFPPGSGFVVLGRLMHGFATTVLAPLVGVYILWYAWGLWHGRSWARPVGIAYAIWATLNVVLFPLIEGVPARFAP